MHLTIRKLQNQNLQATINIHVMVRTGLKLHDERVLCQVEFIRGKKESSQRTSLQMLFLWTLGH